MSFYDRYQILAAARAAPFYADLYKELPRLGYAWHDVPIATLKMINRSIYGDCTALMTCRSTHGMYYLSSGSTNQAGKPKTSFFARDEWREMIHLIAATQWKHGVIRAHDTVLNITPAGNASNLLVHDTIQQFPVPCSEVPLGAETAYPKVINTCRQFKASVIVGLNSTLVGLADSLLQGGQCEPSVERLLGGGELLYGAQLDMLKVAFPRATFVPFCYASTDGGLMGYSDLSSGDNSYRVFNEACVLEIVDPTTHEVIREPHRVGMVVTTSLLRLAMPVLRYAVGDLGCWLDDPSGPSPRFSLMGRITPVEHDFAGVFIKESDIAALIAFLKPKLRISWLQVVLAGSPRQPRLEVVMSLFQQNSNGLAVEQLVRDGLAACIPHLGSADRTSICVRVVKLSIFEEQTRRKGRLLVDLRSKGKSSPEADGVDMVFTE